MIPGDRAQAIAAEGRIGINPPKANADRGEPELLKEYVAAAEDI